MSQTHEVASRERPILMSGPMVRAILEGRKTQTRRIVTNLPTDLLGPFRTVQQNGSEWLFYKEDPMRSNPWEVRCPYGIPGDRLYVREAFQVIYDGGSTWSVLQPTGLTEQDGRVIYRASEQDPDPDEAGRFVWRPSIHMPKRFARIWLRVTDVRVERVQEISETDAMAEGMAPEVRAGTGLYRAAFRTLWDSLNLKRGYGWDTNCWVWVVTFEVEQ